MPCVHFACVCFAGLDFVVESFAKCSFFRGDSNKLVGFSYYQWFRTKLVACVSNTIGRGDKVGKRAIKCEDSAANSIVERSTLLQYISDVDGDYLGVVLGAEAIPFHLEVTAHFVIFGAMPVMTYSYSS